MILRIDHSAAEPLYVQIRNQIVAAVARGELRAGDGLPSVRALASDLGINLHTVNKAYAVLRDEGYLVMRGRSGARVADAARVTSAERRADAEAALAETLAALAVEYKARGGSGQAFVNMAAQAAAQAFGAFDAQAVTQAFGTSDAQAAAQVFGACGAHAVTQAFGACDAQAVAQTFGGINVEGGRALAGARVPDGGGFESEREGSMTQAFDTSKEGK